MEIIETDKAPAAVGPYSQAVACGEFLFLSGQLGIDPKTGVLDGDMASQARRACENIGAILAAAGFSFENVVKTTCYLVDMADFTAFNTVYAEYFTGLPARSCVAVRALPKGGLCEIEVVARK
ncbi:MAG: regulator [Clostridiales bacterium]|nr:MAG: regulator [Clostridiales bacterium]